MRKNYKLGNPTCPYDILPTVFNNINININQLDLKQSHHIIPWFTVYVIKQYDAQHL